MVEKKVEGEVKCGSCGCWRGCGCKPFKINWYWWGALMILSLLLLVWGCTV